MNAQKVDRPSYILRTLNLKEINTVLLSIANHMTEALNTYRLEQYTTQEAFNEHTHALSELSERNYSSLEDRPADDDFSKLKSKNKVLDKDRIPLLDKASKSYKTIDAEFLIPPKPATTIITEKEFGQSEAVGLFATYAREDHTHGTPTITDMSDYMADAYAMATAGVWYDGPSLALMEGLWLVCGTVTVRSPTATAQIITVKMWDGTNVYASTEGYSPIVAADVACVSLSLSALVTVLVADAPKTVKISCVSSVNNSIISDAASHNGAGDTASFVNAVRIGPSV